MTSSSDGGPRQGLRLSVGERSLLARLADALVPAQDGMPSASQVGVQWAGLDRVQELRPELLRPLHRALTVAGALADPTPSALRNADPDAFAALAAAVAGAYLTEPRVSQLLGYPGRPALEVGDPTAQLAELRRLTAPVRARGSIWAATPDPPA